MSRFVYSPNLPQGRVEALLIGGMYLDILGEPLKKIGIDAIALPDNPSVSALLRGHADLMAFHCGGNVIVLSKAIFEDELVNILTNRGFYVFRAAHESAAEYPGDIGLCGAFFGNRFVHNMKFTDPEIIRCLPAGTKYINVKQGYAKCSVAIIGSSSLITSDKTIYKKAMLENCDALIIEPGTIELPGFDTGFIGGSAFMIERDRLALTGRFIMSETCSLVESFLKAHHITPVYLTDRPIFDIGGAIQIVEENAPPN